MSIHLQAVNETIINPGLVVTDITENNRLFH